MSLDDLRAAKKAKRAGPSSNGRAASAARVTKRDAIIRAQTILHLVQDGTRWSPARLAKRLRVCERTIYRSIDDLTSAGVGIEYDRAARSYRLTQPFIPAPVQLTEEEAFALAAMCQEIGGHQQISFFGPAGSALEKIRAILPEDARRSVEHAQRDVVIKAAAGAEAPDDHLDVYRRVREAMFGRRVLVCEYDSLSGRGAGEEFRFEPYALFFAVRAWYAVGRHGGRDAIRCLKLKRFGAIRVLEDRYEVPPDFSIREHLGNAWSMIRGEPDLAVEVRISPEFAETLADTQWHRTQEIEEHEDGSATFRCTVSGLDEIVWWVLGLGPHARVVRPTELAERVRRLASEMAALYPA